MPNSVELWQVYYLFCTYTKPSPKNKYVAIMCFDEEMPMGILINSEIHPFVQARNYLLPCEVKLEQQIHNFLTHDSYLDCRDIFPFPEAQLTDYKGVIHEEVRADVITAVKACTVLTLKFKMKILEQCDI